MLAVPNGRRGWKVIWALEWVEAGNSKLREKTEKEHICLYKFADFYEQLN
jgi:hypothetical protein